MSASLEALARWWAALSADDRAHLRAAATTNTVDERARTLIGGQGSLWAVYETYFSRGARRGSARIAENVRQFILRQGQPREGG